MKGVTYVIRPAVVSDVERLERLIAQVRAGITSLAIDRDTLLRRLEQSEASFEAHVSEPGDERYFFVLEDPERYEIAGMCAIRAAVGLVDAFYSYRVGTEVHASKELGIHRRLPALYLSNDYTGCSELTSLFLGPGERGRGLGTLLSKSRFLFMAEFPRRFADKVIAEIRGVSDDEGRSPFWDGLGQHFFAMDFPTADHLVGAGNKSFIAELMPKHPIYVLFLPQEAQDAIGKPHGNSERALELLVDEGFHYESYIDIFDAGPTVECRRTDIRAVRQSHHRRVRIAAIEAGGRRALLSNTLLRRFRCCLAEVSSEGADVVTIERATADALQVSEGEPLRVLSL